MQKRLMFVAILLLAICNRIVAEDQITIGDFSLYSGDTKAVSVMLTNEDSYVGFQFDLYLPDGITVESFSANSSRFPEGTTPQMSQQSDGSYRFVAAALERNPIVGNEGAILTLTIKAADSIVAKDYTGYLRNIKISKTDGTGVTKAEQTFTITVKGAEAYAVLTGDTISGMTLTFYYDTKKEQRGGMNVGPFSDYSDYEANSGWYAQCGSITSAVFDPSFANCTTITSTAWWFDYCTKLTSITGLNYLNTANVTDMKAMFRYCMNLTNLDVSGFKTDNVTDMSGMFSRCQSLTSLDVSGFKTDKVTDMSYMFEECLNLTNLDVSGFKTDNVTNMGWMFDKCHSLTSLDVTGFNTQNVTDMSNMFHNCFGLTSLDLSNFNTQNVTNMHYMFRCTNLTSLDVSHFNTQNVTDMSDMFIDCRSLTSLDVTNFNTKNVTGMSNMFSGCSSLTSLDLSNFNTQNVAGMSNMFQNCSSLTTIYAGSEWSTTAVTKSTDMFNGCTNLVGGQGTAYDSLHVDVTYAHIDGGPDNPGYFTDIADYGKINEPYAVLSENNTVLTFYYDKKKSDRGGMELNPFSSEQSSPWYNQRESITTVVFDESIANCTTLTSTAWWFWHCSNLSTITGMSYLKTNSVTNMEAMFEGCSSLTSLDVSSFNTSNVTKMVNMFRECSALTSLDLSNFNTENVTEMQWMFYNSTSLTTVDVSHFNTGKVKDMGAMFSHCSGLTSLDVSNFNTSSATTLTGMFEYCSSLTSLDVSHFNTAKNTDMGNMFRNCSSLTSLDLSNFDTNQAVKMHHLFSGCSNLTTVYVGSDWTIANVLDSGESMFAGCSSIEGGEGTTFDADHIDYTYAHIDGGPDNPGYFTDIADLGKVNEPYAILTGDTISGMTLTFYYDKRKEERNGMDVGPFRGSYDESLNIIVPNSGWFDQRESITTVVFDPSFADCTTLTSTAFWFHYMTQLRTIEGIRYLKTDNVTDMGYMFCHCSSLTALDVSGFKTDNVKDVHSMFSNCTSLASLDVSGFKTDNVEDMDGTFGYCSSLTSLDLSNFNTSNVKSMLCTFEGCSGLTSLDLSNFNTEKVEWMTQLFFKCSNLTTLDLSGFKTENVKVMSLMFERCPALKTIYVGEGWSTAKVDANSEMFQGCTSLVGGMGTTYDANHIDATYAHIDGGPDNPGYFTRSGDAPYVAPELYAVLEENASANSMVDAAPNRAATAKTYTMKFYYDGKKTERNGMSVETYREATTREWDNMAESITNVVFDLTVVNDTAITSTGYWFSGFTQLTSIEGLNYLNTSHVADTWAMFEKCSSLKEVNLSNFDTRNVKTMGLMFYGCENLLNLDVSSFNTANVTHTNSMFANCIGLTSLDLSGFNTRKVENMSEMFLNCTHLTTIYAGSDWSTESSAGGGKMFGSCYSLVGGMGTTYDENHIDATYAHIDGGADNPGYLTDIADLGKEREPYAALSSDGLVVTFYYDRKKEDRGGVDINNRFLNTHEATDVSPYGSATTAVFNASFADYKPTSTAYWFCKCSSLKTIRGIENLNTVDVTDMSSMFYSCDSLTSIDVSGFNTENVTNMNSMFGLCYSLARLDVSNFNTENVTNMGVMFSNCHELTNLDLSNFKTDNVTDMSHMFSGSWNLTSVNLSGFNTKNVKDMSFMFYGCFDLQSLDISHFNTANVTNMRTMFYGCGISSLDLSGFNTAKVTEMSAMFSSCRSLKTIFAGDGWSTAKVEDGIDMFMECTSLVGGMGTAYDSLHIDYTYARIDQGPSNPGYFTDIKGPSQKVATPSLAWTDDMLTISTTTEDATICYTISDIGNGRDTLTYSAPIEVKRDVLIRTWAEHMGMFASDTITLDYPYTAWQQLREAIEYSMITVAMCQGSPKVKQEDVVRLQYMAENANAYYSHRELQRDEIERMVGELMVLSAMLRSQLEAVEYVYDSTNGVLTISGGTTVAEALEAAGGSSAASALTSIIWQNTTPLTNDDLKGLDNPNMLIYVADASLAPANRDNVIIGNDSTGYTAMNIVLADVADGNGDFYCPIAFTADMISYTHEYRQQTEVGVARGWETIAMPFTVQTITHEKNGVISPFGNDASTKHFWLRQLTQQGLAQARQIEANTPYLISMPNSDAYPVEFNQAGRVTFSSQNATVPVTQLNVMEAPTATGGMVMIQPNFKGQSATSMIYALNVGVPRGDHPEGSVFEANYRSVRPFEAFTVHHGDGPAPQFISIVDINNGGTTGIEDVRSLMSDGRGDNWYDLNGRRLQQKPTRKGVYILNGNKVVIK